MKNGTEETRHGADGIGMARMSTAMLLNRLTKLDVKMAASIGEENLSKPDIQAAIHEAVSRSGVWPRLNHIVRYGASPDDLDWLEQQTKETGVDFPFVVEILVKLDEEY